MTEVLQLIPVPSADLQKRSRKQTKNLILVMVLCGVFGAVAGYGLASMNRELFRNMSRWELLWMIPALWGAIAWHELGHVIGAQLSGFRLMMFTAGPVLIERKADRLRLAYNRTPMYWGGLAASVPPPDYPQDLDRLRGDMLRIVVFGPLFSVLGGLAVWLGTPGLFFGMFSVLLALATAIPQRAGGFASDGLRAVQLTRKGKAAERWAALAGLMGSSMTARPREWPEAWVNAGSEPMEQTLDGISGAWLRSTWHLDRNEPEQAEEWLAWAVHNAHAWPAPMRPTLYISAAFLLAWARKDLAGAREYVKMAGTRAAHTDGGKLAEAACLLLEGKQEEAASLLHGIHRTPGLQPLLSEMLREGR